jgi:arsenite-transporting ATPase
MKTLDFKQALKSNLIFIEGKGGVGKTTVAKLLAQTLSEQGLKTVRVAFEDPEFDETRLVKLSDHEYFLNIEPLTAFEEYAGLKIGAPKLVRIFLQNKLMRYLAQAAPGVKELVMMGKIWNERDHFDHLIIDMPSSGHALTYFQSVLNWKKLFGQSVLAKDANAMIETFNDPHTCSHLLLSLPEEMPLIESLEFEAELRKILPAIQGFRVINKLTPPLQSPSLSTDSLLDAKAYLHQKALFEKENLNLLGSTPYLSLELSDPLKPSELKTQLERILS